MKTLQVYETSDGKRFEDKTAAKRHETELEALELLRSILDTSIKTGRPESILRHVLLEAADVMEVLRTYQRKQPKTKAPLAADQQTQQLEAEAKGWERAEQIERALVSA
jgi:dihydropteroate synthase